MPVLSRWCVRFALIYLVAEMGLGSWMLIEQADGHDPGATWPVLRAHTPLVGFLLLFVWGSRTGCFPALRAHVPAAAVAGSHLRWSTQA